VRVLREQELEAGKSNAEFASNDGWRRQTPGDQWSSRSLSPRLQQTYGRNEFLERPTGIRKGRP
jgi:hypothetical protein